MRVLVHESIDDAALARVLEDAEALVADGELPRVGEPPLEARVSLSRTFPDDWADRTINVWVNGERLRPIRYGQTIEVSLPPGRHSVKVHNTLRGKSLEFDAAPGEHVRLACGNQTAAGGLLMMLMMGVAALRVRLERLSGSG
jgi:hypothetical protein